MEKSNPDFQRTMLVACISTQLAQRVAAFTETPSAINFSALEDAMYAWQFINGSTHQRDWADAATEDEPVGRWLDIIVKKAMEPLSDIKLAADAQAKEVRESAEQRVATAAGKVALPRNPRRK